MVIFSVWTLEEVKFLTQTYRALRNVSKNKLSKVTSSHALAENPRDASCLS